MAVMMSCTVFTRELLKVGAGELARVGVGEFFSGMRPFEGQKEEFLFRALGKWGGEWESARPYYASALS